MHYCSRWRNVGACNIPRVTPTTPHVGPTTAYVNYTSCPHLLYSPSTNVVGYQCVAFSREVTLEKKGQLPPVIKVDNKVSSTPLSTCCGHYVS